MAVLLGAFLILGIQPGAMMMTKHLDLVWTLIWALIVGNLIAVAILLVPGEAPRRHRPPIVASGFGQATASRWSAPLGLGAIAPDGQLDGGFGRLAGNGAAEIERIVDRIAID